MKLMQKLVNEPFARGASRFMKVICYLVMAFILLSLVLCFMGRQTFTLHTSTGTYENAIYAEENHEPASRSLTIYSKDDIRVWVNSSGQVDFSTHIGLSLMVAVNVIPLLFAYWFLSRVFANVQKGEIFTEKNAACLFYYGVLQFFTALLAPFVKLLICGLTNLISDSRISFTTGQDMLSGLIPSIAFLVAAYIVHYGIHLQDEVDHTL